MEIANSDVIPSQKYEIFMMGSNFKKTTTPSNHITMGKSTDEALVEEIIDLDEDPILMSIL